MLVGGSACFCCWFGVLVFVCFCSVRLFCFVVQLFLFLSIAVNNFLRVQTDGNASIRERFSF